MTSATATLARSITWAGSKQSYLTARLLADRDLVDDCLRAYAYFRWADDQIDISLPGSDDRSAFIERQKSLIDQLYRGAHPNGLLPQETMLADLIAHDRTLDSGLSAFIHNFLSVIAFDAKRKGYFPGRHELAAYTTCLATAVMDGLQYFIGNHETYPRRQDRNLAVTGAHITHMLRDMLEDLSNGLVNIPAEDIETYGIVLQDVNNAQFRRWVREQVDLARYCFRAGKIYIDSLKNLRCKLAGVWYCGRFECVLNAIQRDGYCLRKEYPEPHAYGTWLEMIRLGFAITLKHFADRIWNFFFRLNRPSELGF